MNCHIDTASLWHYQSMYMYKHSRHWKLWRMHKQCVPGTLSPPPLHLRTGLPYTYQHFDVKVQTQLKHWVLQKFTVQLHTNSCYTVLVLVPYKLLCCLYISKLIANTCGFCATPRMSLQFELFMSYESSYAFGTWHTSEPGNKILWLSHKTT